jgi:hypothetical protein
MYWQYRVVKKLYGERDEKGKIKDPESEFNEYGYGVHEVYFDHNDKATMCTENPITVYGDTIKEAAHEWLLIMDAFNKPIIDFDNIPEEGSYNEVEEARKSLLNENNELMSMEEAEEKGLVTHSFEDFKKSVGMDDFDLKEYRNEQVVEQQKAEKEYQEKLVGKPISEAFGAIVELCKEFETEGDEE